MVGGLAMVNVLAVLALPSVVAVQRNPTPHPGHPALCVVVKPGPRVADLAALDGMLQGESWGWYDAGDRLPVGCQRVMV